MTQFIPITFMSNGQTHRGLLNLMGNRMPYLATWLKGLEIVAEEHFDDLLVAQDFVLEHMTDYRKTLGADGVKVWNGRTVYFQWYPSRSA